MSEHLSPEKIKLFLKDQLPPDEAVTILIHLDNCQECHNLIPQQSPEEVLEIFFRDDSVEREESKPEDPPNDTKNPVLKPKSGLIARLKKWLRGFKDHLQMQ